MGQRLVDEIELNPLRSVVAINCLQTGDISEERRSGETAKDKNGVFAFEATHLKGVAVGIEDRNVWQWGSDL